MRTLPFMTLCAVLVFLSLALLPGCNRGGHPAVADALTAVQPSLASAAPAAAVDLRDVIETTPDYIIGISYPQVAAHYPPLAQAVHDYAVAARLQLMQARAALHGTKPAIPYDLSLLFSSVADTPRVVAVTAEGSSYTGGAHGAPLLECFVWLPRMQQMLAAEQLIPDTVNWKPVSAFVRERLLTLLSQQLDADSVEATDRAQLLQSGSQKIDAGTAPEAANFSRFEPVMNADGSIRALRFVFPPEQVGTYAEGKKVVEVPASLLLPLVAPAYRPLFRVG